MKKTPFFLALLSLAGVASVWFLATTPSENESQELTEREKKEEETARTVELVGTLLKKSIAAVPVSAPQPIPTGAPVKAIQNIPKPAPIADDVIQDAWATSEQKRELTIRENKQELERDQEILTDPVAWKQKQRELEKEWQLRELARLEKLQEEAPQEYEAQLRAFEEQKTEREIEFEERIQQQIDRVIEKNNNRESAGS